MSEPTRIGEFVKDTTDLFASMPKDLKDSVKAKFIEGAIHERERKEEPVPEKWYTRLRQLRGEKDS